MTPLPAIHEECGLRHESDDPCRPRKATPWGVRRRFGPEPAYPQTPEQHRVAADRLMKEAIAAYRWGQTDKHDSLVARATAHALLGQEVSR